LERNNILILNEKKRLTVYHNSWSSNKTNYTLIQNQLIKVIRKKTFIREMNNVQFKGKDPVIIYILATGHMQDFDKK
jgi:uncharacterized membrane protein